MIQFHVDWYCPNCPTTDSTPPLTATQTRMHHCPRLGIDAPLIKAGVKAKVEAHERDDYVGDELVRLNDAGRPVMNVMTTRDDGTDLLVFAPTARVRIG